MRKKNPNQLDMDLSPLNLQDGLSKSDLKDSLLDNRSAKIYAINSEINKKAHIKERKHIRAILDMVRHYD